MMNLLSRRIALTAFIAFALVLATISAVNAEGTCNNLDGNADESCLAAEAETNADKKRQQPPPNKKINKPNPRIAATFRNESPHRADIHYDDGRFGNIVGTAEANGGEVNINTFGGHRFFVTMHGE